MTQRNSRSPKGSGASNKGRQPGKKKTRQKMTPPLPTIKKAQPEVYMTLKALWLWKQIPFLGRMAFWAGLVVLAAIYRDQLTIGRIFDLLFTVLCPLLFFIGIYAIAKAPKGRGGPPPKKRKTLADYAEEDFKREQEERGLR